MIDAAGVADTGLLCVKEADCLEVRLKVEDG